MKTLQTWVLVTLCSISVALYGQTPTYSTQDIIKDLNYFSDWSASALVKGFKKKHLNNFNTNLMRELAEKLYKGEYQSRYLLNNYKPVASDKVLERKLKLHNGYSRYENMTGVYLEQGENVVLVGDLHGQNVSLLIPDWMRRPAAGINPTEDPEGWGLKRQVIELHEGVNVIYVEKAGNVYLDYFSDIPEIAPAITIHFVTGKVNGYFDAEVQNNDDWKNLLDHAVGPVMDVKTKYMQLAYPVEFLKKFRYNEGKELAEAYDKIMEQQYTFNGAMKYNRIPDKRILARVNHNYYMFRDGDGVSFFGDEGTMKAAVGPEIYRDWGVNHEIGHVMQMSQLTWTGMGEVSNNLFTLFVTAQKNKPGRLTEGKDYERAFKHIRDAEKKPFIMCVDEPFEKLVPFWQLHLYAQQKGYPDFYADMMEYLRNHPSKGWGKHSVNDMYEFVKVTCDLLKTDLTVFFEDWGFFVTGTFHVTDYASQVFEVTPKMVQEVKQYIASKGYPVPDKELSRLTD